ncbi:MAG TPA: hypothetical protein VIE65_20505 [Methylobacter sp.]|jgi:hypothetical protein
MIDSTKLRPAQVAGLVQVWLNRKGYSNEFQNDISMLLAENRRARRSNVAKYGSIPFSRGLNGKVYYDFVDLKKLCQERLEPICKERQRQRLEKADKAAKGARLSYAA